MTGFTDDEQALLDLHRDWWYSNYNVNIPLMRTVFPKGDRSYVMYNLNGHPYFGVDELATLWEWYSRTENFGLTEDHVMRVEVYGNLGYVLSEGLFPVDFVRADDGTPIDPPRQIVIRCRSTEIYTRDDGAGEPEWRMWHFHCSPRPGEDEVPPSKTTDETARARGMGNTPYSTAMGLDYSVYDR